MHPSRRLAPKLALVALVSLAVPAAAADPGAGGRLFKIQCGACHAVAPGTNMVGPSLAGIVGRHSGMVEGFRYSSANGNAHVVWTPEVLNRYLANPQKVVPGTTMAYAGLSNETQRGDLIAYLETLK
jgi:cytochrome c2